MTALTGSAQKIADEFVRAWLGRDVETAMGFIADDIVCEAPTGRFEGRDSYRQFLEPFASALLGGAVIDILGDDTHAAAVYTTDTPFAKDFRAIDYLTVEDGKITRSITVFDLAPALRARGDLQN
ncbi:nuclear transport factor 2 family protein [Streptomyces sp. NPDC021098]|uniref:nuclear transport factor 2 family protein n=1 Tax=unclassified Streptomyces TaxID=2593676 RepID=UPI00378C54B7